MSGPGIKFGHFTLGKRLARGGMAEVFLARQRGPEGFDRRVAVKRILPHLAETSDFVRMFLDEARLAARLSHPNIVHIYELGQVDGDYFIAMEFVDGVHAGQLVAHAATEPLPPVLVARLGADAAGALAYAHRLEDSDGRPLQLVHRDVSPHNIMVSLDGVTKLVDFGIAKAALKADETRPGIVKGKYAYMSPEQTVGRPLDGRSDVFSLGIVLWEILAGTTLVDRGDVVEAMKVIRDGRYAPIEQVAPRTPPALAQAIGWALAHKRDDRATAAQLQVALEEFIKSAPQIATAGQLAEWIRPRFPRHATGVQPVVDDEVRPRRASGPPPVATSAGRALPRPPAPRTEGVRALPRTGTAQVDVTDAPPALRAGTVRVDVTDAVPPLRPGTVRVDMTGASPVLVAGTDAVAPLPPPPRAQPPPLPASVRAPTHLDTDLDDLPEDGPDAPTRLRIPSTIMTVAPPTSRVAIGLAVAVAIAVAIGLAVLIAGGGSHRATGPDDAAVRTLGPDADPEVIELGGGSDPAGDGIEIELDPPGPIDAGAATADATTAILEIATRPAGARLRIDGRPPATSPARFALRPGRVTVAVSKDGYTAIERTVTLGPGEHRALELDLDRGGGGGGGGGGSRPAAEVGYLTVRTNPYSVVTLGGRTLGETPFASVPVPAGNHILTFTNPDRRTVKRTVLIRAGQTLKLSFQIP